MDYSYLYDGKGNVTMLVDSSGWPAGSYQYDPFGVPLDSGGISQPMQFSTKPYDPETGLSYFGYRFYAPAPGRWMTRDPLGERGGINLYGFVGNNPTNLIDAFGLVDCNLLPSGPRQADPDLKSFWDDKFNNDPYFYSVAAHGTPNFIYNETGMQWSPQQLADYLLDPNSGYIPGKPVVLFSCSTGRGDNSFAQQLANILKADVWAPIEDLSPGSVVGPVLQNDPGAFNRFSYK